MIEGFFHYQRNPQNPESWRNSWCRVDADKIHLFYRPNCPARGVKANRVAFFLDLAPVGHFVIRLSIYRSIEEL